MIKIGMLIADRYEVLEKVGTGGMSDVYKAKDHRLNRMVAVKVLKQEFSENATFVSKFRVEAQAAAGLMHPNIVNVYDVGEEKGTYYIIMELVNGITLKRYIEKKVRLTPREAVTVAIQVAMGLAAAHRNHIIHRDIKPQNIIISKEGKVKVTDFGIAKASTSNTITSNVMGSVHYTSPEQARGGYSDEKSDVYSLGVTLFEMVTGRVPYDGETTVAVALQHIQDPFPSPRDLVPDLPFSVEQIILKCCEKSPDRRYQTMDELTGDLRHSLNDPDGDFVHRAGAENLSETRAMSAKDREEIRRRTSAAAAGIAGAAAGSAAAGGAGVSGITGSAGTGGVSSSAPGAGGSVNLYSGPGLSGSPSGPGGAYGSAYGASGSSADASGALSAGGEGFHSAGSLDGPDGAGGMAGAGNGSGGAGAAENRRTAGTGDYAGPAGGPGPGTGVGSAGGQAQGAAGGLAAGAMAGALSGSSAGGQGEPAAGTGRPAGADGSLSSHAGRGPLNGPAGAGTGGLQGPEGVRSQGHLSNDPAYDPMAYSSEDDEEDDNELEEDERRLDKLIQILSIVAVLVVGAVIILVAVSRRGSSSGQEETQTQTQSPQEMVVDAPEEAGTQKTEEETQQEPEMVLMPRVIGKTQEEAEEALTRAELTWDVTYNTSDTYGEGVVMDASAREGDRLEKGASVTITVVRIDKVKVPDVTGKKRADAESALQSAGLKASVEEIYSDETEAGYVESQDPDEGEQAAKGSSVTIYVSMGPDLTGMVQVPNILGMTEQEASAELLRVGLTPGETSVTDTSGRYAPGTVIGQSIEKGEYVDEGTRVDMELSGEPRYSYSARIEAPRTSEDPDYEEGTPVTLVIRTEDGNELLNTTTTNFPYKVSFTGIPYDHATLYLTYVNIIRENSQTGATEAEFAEYEAEQEITRELTFTRD